MSAAPWHDWPVAYAAIGFIGAVALGLLAKALGWLGLARPGKEGADDDA